MDTFHRNSSDCRFDILVRQKILTVMPANSQSESIAHARTVMQIEIDGITGIMSRLDQNFDSACQMVLACSGRVVVIGMGKSGHIGGKIAATLASTGSPAFFVHPGEASHGDLGMIMPQDLVIGISNTGETAEVVSIVPIVKKLGVKMIAMTGNVDSTLAHQAEVCLDVGVEKEACAHNLAPTASTTATLVMGDALAVAVQRMRGFTAQDFARTHPGGMLGKRLLLYARDLMHTGDDLPLVKEQEPLGNLLLEMSSKSLGMVGVINDKNELIGMFTDGDLRRTLESKVDVYASKASDLMTKSPFTIDQDMLAVDIVRVMREFAQKGPHALNGLFVVDKHSRVVGALNTHDRLRAGVI